jgi:cell division protein FtsB
MDLRVEKASAVQVLRHPELGLRAVVEHAPQAEALFEGWLERARPIAGAAYAARRRLATTGVALLTGWLFLHVMFGANGMVVYRTKRADYQKLQIEIERLQKENDQYTREIKSLQTDPEAIEKEAREELHYTKPGEVVFVQPSQPRLGTDAARK